MTDRARLSILHVVALVGAGGEFGGPVSVAEAQARELSRRGHDVVVTGLSRGDVHPPAGLTASQWRTFPARRLIPRSGMLGLTNARFLGFLWTAARRADVMHVHAGRDLTSLSALLIAKLRSVPVVVAQTHGMVLPRTHLRARLFDPVFLRLLRRASAVLYMTEDEQRDLAEQLGPAARLRFLSNGLEVLPPHPDQTPAELPQVLFLARLHPVKRATAFVQMAALLTERGVRARFVIHGPDQGDLAVVLALIEQHTLQDVVTYGGPLDHERAVEVLSRSAVYVLPSRVDWMPMSLLEALAAGVPSVCTDTSGLADTLRETGSAVVTDGSVDALAAAVQHLLTEPTEWARLSEAGRRVIADRYSVRAVVDVLEGLY